jgi:two-component system, LuxR family, sensor kinase FixL
MQRTDLTDRSAGDALVESEAKIRAILDTAVDGIVTIDERGTVQSFNAAAERLFGYRSDEVIGRSVNMLMPEPYRSEHARYMQRYLNDGQPRIIGIGREVIGLRKDGHTFPMDLAVSEVKLGGRRMFTGIVRDLTERKRMERELLEISDREQRRIGQDLHDGLGQVLAGVGYMITSLQQRLASREAPEAGDAEQISDLITQAIGQARGMARGLHPVRPMETGLMTALEELSNHVAQVYRIVCEFRCDEPVLMEDTAAANHVYRIAQEAMTNAIKHGQAKKVTIALTEDRGEGTLVVADDGVGIGELPAVRKGMGLHIMRYRASMIGATVSIRRGSVGGTIVTCSFPMGEVNERGDDAAKSE